MILEEALELVEEDIAADVGDLFPSCDNNAEVNCSLSSLSSMMPPLDHLTVCSDDTDSVSDMSSNDGCSSSSAPRSIFKRYWEKNGGAPALSRAPMHCVDVPQDPMLSQDPMVSCCYEKSLQAKEIKETDASFRRKIFGQGCWSVSEPRLNLKAFAVDYFRKTQSSSALSTATPNRSCLRKGRFSGVLTSDTTESTENSSVSFCSDVDVVVFHPPTELWAAKGWSEWFAF
jgi:hypothetical protein